jgi:hypothetical protein
MKSLLPALVICALGALLAGCSSTPGIGSGQSVDVYSFPAGADVYANGEFKGQTPTTVSLDKTTSHEIQLSKKHFRTASAIVAPSGSDKEPFLKWGLLEEIGYYSRLAPDPVEVSLRADVIPTAQAYDSFEEFSYLSLLVDQLLETGEISPNEHKYITRQLIEFYTN